MNPYEDLDVSIPESWFRQPLWTVRLTVTNEDLWGDRPAWDRMAALPPMTLRSVEVVLTNPRTGAAGALGGLPGYLAVFARKEPERPPMLVFGVPIDEANSEWTHRNTPRSRTDTAPEPYMTAREAEQAGYTVDRTTYPWTAYSGPRFGGGPSRPVQTPAVLDGRDVR